MLLHPRAAEFTAWLSYATAMAATNEAPLASHSPAAQVQAAAGAAARAECESLRHSEAQLLASEIALRQQLAAAPAPEAAAAAQAASAGAQAELQSLRQAEASARSQLAEAKGAAASAQAELLALRQNEVQLRQVRGTRARKSEDAVLTQTSMSICERRGWGGAHVGLHRTWFLSIIDDCFVDG